MKLTGLTTSTAFKKMKHYAPPTLTMGIPVAYVIGEHISWKRKKPDSLRRMIIQQASFWICAIAGGILMHDTHFQNRSMKWKLPRFALASALIIGGFAGGERLAKTLYPKKLTSPVPTASFPASSSPLVLAPLSSQPINPFLWSTPFPKTTLPTGRI